MLSNTQRRVIVLVLDSFGIGALEDAAQFNDTGANTLGHIDKYCFDNNLSFQIPTLLSLGLGQAYYNIHNKLLYNDKNNYPLIGSYSACKEKSSGKDTTSGHWEMMGYPVLFEWGYFKNINNTFPNNLLKQIQYETQIKGFLGNCHASGTEIIKQYGKEHIKTKFPIIYTSADSVFQVAAHETYFGLENLYQLCEKIRNILTPYNIARVIARPFTGENTNDFIRTNNRKDFSVKPQELTLLDICKQNNGIVVAIGKIADIFAHQGITHEIKAAPLDKLCEATLDAIKTYTQNNTLIMTNFVDFDMLYGHRRDVLGYKKALEYFDTRLQQILQMLQKDDMLIITADHGCDPTFKGTDHTREFIPFLIYHNKISKALPICESFADIGQTIASYLNLPKLKYGINYYT